MNALPLIDVDLVALVEDSGNGNPIVVLHDRVGNRLLPIWIGDQEARAIAIALNKIKSPRPMTHQLLLEVLAKMGACLTRIVIDRLKNNTYYASLYVEKGGVTSPQSGEVTVIDARPSDAVTLALFAKVPILVVKEVMDAGAQPNPFPGMAARQEKRELKKEDIERLREMLKRAREREEKS